MKKLLSILLAPIVILIFCSTAIGQDEADTGNAEISSKYVRIVKTVAAKKEERQSALLAYQSQTERYVKFNFNNRHCWYCTPCFGLICEKLCGDVSPSKPGGGSSKWGRKCSPLMERKCERCGFIQ